MTVSSAASSWTTCGVPRCDHARVLAHPAGRDRTRRVPRGRGALPQVRRIRMSLTDRAARHHPTGLRGPRRCRMVPGLRRNDVLPPVARARAVSTSRRHVDLSEHQAAPAMHRRLDRTEIDARSRHSGLTAHRDAAATAQAVHCSTRMALAAMSIMAPDPPLGSWRPVPLRPFAGAG